MVDASAGTDFGNWIVSIGMLIGGIGAGFAARSGWKSGADNGAGKEFAFSGQAAITDLGPIRDLVKEAALLTPRLQAVVGVVESLALQQGRTAASIEKLVGIVEDYIEAQQTERDNEEEVERRVAERLATANADEVRKQVRAMNARNTRTRAARRKENPAG